MIYDTGSQQSLKIVVIHEVGHAVVAELLGRPIKHIQIAYRKRDSEWYGNTPLLNDYSSDITSPWPILHLVPEDQYKYIRDWCIIKFAGSVTERQMGVDEKIVLEGHLLDIQSANTFLSEKFPPEKWEEERRNAEMLARNILSNPIHWCKVQIIAQGMIDAIVQGRGPQRSNDYRDEYEFSRDEIMGYESLILTRIYGATKR